MADQVAPIVPAPIPDVPVADQVKAGIKSSEMWISVIAAVIQCVQGLPAGCKIGVAVVAVVYTIMRSIVKAVG